MRNEKLDGGMVLKHQRERIYSESEVEKATNNYDDHQKLGQRGFGCVYKGVLPYYTQLGVKKFKGVDKAQMNEDFQHEILMVEHLQKGFVLAFQEKKIPRFRS